MGASTGLPGSAPAQVVGQCIARRPAAPVQLWLAHKQGVAGRAVAALRLGAPEQPPGGQISV